MVFKQKKMKQFSQKSTSFVNFDVALHFVGSWFLAVMGAFVYLRHPHVLLLIIVAVLLFFPPGYKYLYYRWVMFKYNKNTILSIDTENGLITYQRRAKLIAFKACDVEKWSWNEYGPFLFWCKFVEIIEVTLKNGDKFIISSGIETRKLIDYLLSSNQTLGLPQGTQTHGFQLKAYVAEIINEISNEE